MRIAGLELNDFRQYHGKQRIVFSRGEKANVTLVIGANGAGKTHLLEAINWCLYGEYILNRGAIVSKESALAADYGQEIACNGKLLYIVYHAVFFSQVDKVTPHRAIQAVTELCQVAQVPG